MREECCICKIHYEHGGKCFGKDGIVPCLIFEEDPQGKWVIETTYYKLLLGQEVPKLRTNYNTYFMDGVPKEQLQFYSMEPVSWIMKGETGIKLKVKVGYWNKEGLTEEIIAEQAAKKRRSTFQIVKK